MNRESLRSVLLPRTVGTSSAMPASALVGIALPIVLLAVVFKGMNLDAPGLLAWSVAIALVAFALPPLRALLATVLAALGGLLLMYIMSGAAPAFSGFELTAFLLASALAWSVGQLLVAQLRKVAALSIQQLNLDNYEKVFGAVFDNSRDCVKLIAADGTILAINQAGLRLAGASHESEMLGHNWFALWESDLQKSLAAAWYGAVNQGKGEFTGSCRVLTGERRFWQNHFSVLQLQAGEPPCVLCISRDITDNLAGQQTLKSATAQLSSLTENIDDAFCSLDSNWTIRFANPSAEKALPGEAGTALLGHNFWEFFRSAKDEEGAICIRRAMERQSVQRCEYFCGARQAWLGITAFPHAAGIGVLIRDLTLHKSAEKLAVEENARLQVAQDIAGYGDWSFDYDQGQLKLSPRAVAMLGLVESPVHEHKKRLLECLHPQDRMTLVHALINSTGESTRLDVTVRLPSDDGERHIRWIGRLMLDSYGDPQRMLGAVQDVTSQLGAEQARAFVGDIVDSLPTSVFVVDKNGRFVTTNRAFATIWRDFYGDEPLPQNFFGENAATQIDGDVTGTIATAVSDMFAGRRHDYAYDYEAVDPRGNTRNFRIQARMLPSSNGRMAVLVQDDLTEARRLRSSIEQNEKSLHELLDQLPAIFFVFDCRQRRLTYVSSAIEAVIKMPRSALLDNKTLFDWIHPDDREAAAASFAERTEGRGGAVEYRLIDADGELHWMQGYSVPRRDEINEVDVLIGLVRDVSAERRSQEKLIAVAYTDDLTGLPNRKALLDALHARGEQAGTAPFALLLANLDRFKNINDTLGHGFGDQLLEQAGRRIRAAVPASVYMARLGSDEFALICACSDIDSVAKQVQGCFEQPFELGRETVFLTVSIGTANCPADACEPNELIKLAGVAAQNAKQHGRNGVQAFQSTMLAPSRERLALENELRLALQNVEFELFYQGKYALRSGELTGAEALLRWRSPTRGLVSPADFIPLLEETGLILQAGEWILAQACQQVRAWHERSGVWLPVAVNVSALQVVNRSFGENAVAILRSSGVPRGVIELEITESSLMSDAVHATQLIALLKEAGFTIALDDFGTGYSSLTYLRKFAPDTLKIDRSFVAELAEKNSDRAIIAIVMQLAKVMHIDVVAEGIESVEQRQLLCEMDCRYGQGYLFCKPLPADQFEREVIGSVAQSEGREARLA